MSEKNPNLLYDSKNLEFREKFWGKIPSSFHQAGEMTIRNFIKNNHHNLNKLKKCLVNYHKSLGIYSPRTMENIDRLDMGSIVVGQQPIIFGGPGLIGNKLASLIKLEKIITAQGLELAPVFFVGDYDGLQKELSRQYFPNPISHNAHIIDSGDFLPEDSNIAAHAAKLPPVEWLLGEIEKIEENFRGFKKVAKGPQKKLLEERLNYILTVIKQAYHRSSTLSEWSTTIWGSICNIINDFGVVFLPTSLPEIRELVAMEYLPFIEKRKEYAAKFDETRDEITSLGYKCTLPARQDDYAPFTLECTNDDNRIATTLRFHEENILATGVCVACKKELSFPVNNVENLASISKIIGPRVDTSQAVFQNILNIQIRISGPGEIAYYAVAAPAVKSIGFNLPIFVKYKRAFYNTLWNEKLGKLLESRKQGTIHQLKLFELIRSRTDAIKKNEIEGIRRSEELIMEFILEQYEKLLSGKQSIDIQKYLGWQFGRFTQHKFGQEVSWVWFDKAIQTGLNDYIQSYIRMYNDHSSLGGMNFINSLI